MWILEYQLKCSNGNNATKLNIKNTLYLKKRVFKLYNMFCNYTFIIF